MNSNQLRHADRQGATMNIRVCLSVAVMLVLAGCVAAAPSGSPARDGSAALATPAPSSAAPGWPAPTIVRLTRDGTHIVILASGRASLEDGRKLATVGPVTPAGRVGEALASGSGSDLVYVAVGDAVSITVSTSSDGGASWDAVPAPHVSGMQAIGDVAAAKVGERVAILLDEATSTAVSSGTVATAARPGEPWAVAPAPIGGTLSSAGGRFWISGGVMGDQVFASSDGTAWRAVKLPTSTRYWTAAAATEVDRLGVVIPVTSHDPGGPSDITFLATSDLGKTWRVVAQVEAPPTEFDTTIPVSITADGHWFAIWPDGSKVIAGALDAKGQTTISPNGLPANVYDVAFTSATTGVAVSSVTTCPNGKSSCTSTSVVTRTDDGGQDWTPMR
jgi:hypothetical protein